MASRPAPPLILTPDQRTAFRVLIEERTGIRLNAVQLRNLDELIADLGSRGGARLSPDELYRAFVARERGELFADFAARLTIGETHFFRVAPQIAALRETVLPDLLQRRGEERALSLWSAGCSTGEEPYTLAILLRELLPAPDGWTIRLLATDLSEPALETALRATYREWSFRETPAWVRERYFVAQGATWQLHEAIRRMVRFERVNLIAETFPAPLHAAASLDLILCRNVTIYFSSSVTQQLYRRFTDLLVPGGWLVLGPSDPAPQACNLEPVYLTNAILWRKPLVAHRVVTTLPPPRQPALPPRPRPAPPSAAVARPRRVAPPPEPAPIDPLIAIRAQIERGELDAARAALTALVREAPLLSAAHRLLGLIALEAGDSAAAAESLRRATFLDAEDSLAQFGLGRAYLAMGDRVRAGAALRQARRVLAPRAPDDTVPGDESLTVERLRRAIGAQLTALDEAEGRAR